VTERKSVLLRLDPAVHDALARWASDELRSTNAQIEYLLRGAPAGARPPPAGPEPPARHRRAMTSPGDVTRRSTRSSNGHHSPGRR
jgi:hypothetical protein